MAKAQLRLKLKKILAEMPCELKIQKSNIISDSLLDLLNSQKLNHLKIGYFAPLEGEEPNIFLNKYFEDNALIFPLIENDEQMSFRFCKFLDLIEVKKFGKRFLTPTNLDKIVEPEVVLMPGLGFDRSGNRLGRGKGYFDRYLENKEVIKIGLCFQEQLVGEIAVTKFDVAVDFIITDREVLRVETRE